MYTGGSQPQLSFVHVPCCVAPLKSHFSRRFPRNKGTEELQWSLNLGKAILVADLCRSLLRPLCSLCLVQDFLCQSCHEKLDFLNLSLLLAFRENQQLEEVLATG